MTAINDDPINDDPINDDPINDDGAADGAHGAKAKRRYRPPELVEYGSIAKLTHGTLTVQLDLLMGGMRMGTQQMMMCL
jgi:hypothetical protein